MRTLLASLCALVPSIALAGDLDRLQIHFDDLSVTDASQQRGFRALQGVDHRPLSGAAFYEAVGRPDLASRYRLNDALRWTLVGTGAAATIGGTVALALMGACAKSAGGPFLDRIEPITCVRRPPNDLAYATVLAGLGALVTGLILDPHPVDAAGAHRLADAYNRDLRARESSLATLQLGVSFQPGGGALAIAGAY